MPKTKRYVEKVILWSCAILALMAFLYPFLQIYTIPLGKILLKVPGIKSLPLTGHDVKYHLLRIEALRSQIAQGVPFRRINLVFFNDAGYASSNCYPDLFLYIPALFRYWGMSIGVSYNLFLILCVIASFFTMFYATKNITKNETTAVVSAIIFTLGQYHIDNIFVRGAVGEIQAFIFFPLVICGAYDLFWDNFKKPWILGIGFTGLLLSHTLSTFIAVVIFSVLTVFFLPKLIHDKKKIITLVMTTGCVLALTIYYWAPLLELMFFMDLGVSISYYNAFAEDHVLPPLTVFKDVQLGGMGVAMYLLCFVRFLIKVPKKNSQADSNAFNLIRFADFCVIAGLACTFMATTFCPWKTLFKFMNVIQFPWRFYLPASLFMSLGASIYLVHYFSQKKKITLALCGVTIFITLFGTMHFKTCGIGCLNYADVSFNDAKYNSNTGNAEWLPYFARLHTKDMLNETRKVVDNQGRQIEYRYDKGSVTVFSEKIPKDAQSITVPLIYYIGYSAELLSPDGQKTALEIKEHSHTGLCVVTLPSEREGEIRVWYKGTVIQKISDVISLVTLFSLIGVFVWKRRKQKKMQTQKQQ